MGQFSYKAVDQGGGHVTGTIEATDRRSAVALLTDRGHFVTQLAEQAGNGEKPRESASPGEPAALPQLTLGGGRVTGKDILAMTTQLSTAVRAGLPLLNCLELIRKQLQKPAMQRMFDHLIKSVNAGQSLSEAMAAHSAFGPLYLSMIRVGETGGILEGTSTQLASILSREEKIKTNIWNASAYPIFLLVMGLISAVVIVLGILPRILSTVDIPVAAMPLPTRMLMDISGVARMLFLTFPGWVVLGSIGAGWYAFSRWSKGPGRLQWDGFKLRIPVFGSVLRTIAVGRFARTLGALTQGGVTILEALAVVRDTLGNEMLAQEIDNVAEKVKRGEALAEPLEASGYFPPLLIQIVAIGEQTGKLDELLLNAAETFDTDADAAITRFMEVFPALVILLSALVIGFIIAAALLPIVMMSLNVGTM